MDPVTVFAPLGDDPPKADLYYGANVIDTLRQLPAESVHTICTSPPFWGLRDYGTPPQVWGGEPGCDHLWKDASCVKCGAWLGELGAEPTPALYVIHIILVFRELHRILRKDGTAWLNLGDSYANDGKWGGSTGGKHASGLHGKSGIGRGKTTSGLKPKDLVGTPWRVAFALQADGWWLRQDIIFCKPNPMPEPVRDRCTRQHEYIFMLSKSKRYFYDNEALREPAVMKPLRRPVGRPKDVISRQGQLRQAWSTVSREVSAQDTPDGKRNRRSVWTISTQPYRGAHFAVWPEALVEPMIKAGTSEKGCCPACGAQWERVIEKEGGRDWRKDKMIPKGIPGELAGEGSYKRGQSSSPLTDTIQKRTVGWQASCACALEKPIPCTVLDPFSGSATTGVVTMRFGRDYIGIDLQEDYLDLALTRLGGAPSSSQKSTETDESNLILDLFGE